MTPEDWVRMSWCARQRLARATSAPRPVADIPTLAREIEARLAPDIHAAEHVALLHHYTSTPRKRTA